MWLANKIKIIFPAPATPAAAAAQVISLARAQVFGAVLPAGQNPADIINLSIQTLRVETAMCVQREGYVVA